MASTLSNTDSLQLGPLYTAHICLISGATHPTAPAAGDELVRAHHLNSIYKCPPNMLLRWLSHNYCCSGGYHITTVAPATMHNYCCSGAHRTITAAPAAIALASSSSSIFDSTDITFSSLDATVPTSRSRLGGRYSFIIFVGGQRKNSLPQKLAISVGRNFRVLGPISRRLQKFHPTEISFFCFLQSFLSPIKDDLTSYVPT